MNKVLIITGPTGSGKTKISIEIAKYLNTEIINGDAFQVYKEMDILTAKITEREKQGIIHHLFDIIEPTEEFNVAYYQQLVRKLIKDISDKKKIPLIVGGSGLYLNSVIYDYNFTAPGRNNLSEFDNYSNEQLYDLLKKINPDATLKIHPNNRKRIIRAIELSQSNAFINTFNNKLLYDAKVIYLNIDRSILYPMLDDRVDKMVEDGLFEEVKKLLKKNLSKTALGAIGLKELIPYFQGYITKETAIQDVKKNTRHYAKRQMTWFRHRDNITVVDVNVNDLDETIAKIKDIIDKWK